MPWRTMLKAFQNPKQKLEPKMIKEASIRPLSVISLSGTRTKGRNFPSLSPSPPVHHVCPPWVPLPPCLPFRGYGLRWLLFSPAVVGLFEHRVPSDSMGGEEAAHAQQCGNKCGLLFKNTDASLHLFHPICFCKWMEDVSEINLLNETILPLLHIISWHLLRIYHFPSTRQRVASIDAVSDWCGQGK